MTSIAQARWRRAPLGAATLKSRHTLSVLLPVLAVSAVLAALLSPEQRMLALPVLAVVNTATWFIVTLWNRDDRLPAFEVGSVWVAATTVYAVVPFLGFMAAGLQWSEFTDGRLTQYPFDLSEIALFAWRYVVYLAAFTICYLAVRGRFTVRHHHVDLPSRQLPVALVLVLGLHYAFKWWMRLRYHIDMDISYAELSQATPPDMPYWLAQVSHNVLSSILLVKLALMVVLFRRWSSAFYRALLILWVVADIGFTALSMGARTSAVLMALAFALLYHRQVRPLRPGIALTAGVVLLAAFLAQGQLRGERTDGPIRATTVLGRTNEFEALFATAFDLHKRQELGTLPPVPWQVYVVDIYLEIPSQLLPFQKIDPAEWYLDVIGARGQGVGFMFGVMSQAVVGWDWLELVLRGAGLGALLAVFHRWYARRARGFWATMLYVFIAIWSYYTFRATSLWFVHFVCYQFVPVMLATNLLAAGLGLARVASRQGAR